MALSAAQRRARMATLAHALSDETRLTILESLRHGERCVCDLMVDADAAQSRLSFHLRVLSDAGLVTGRKDGRWCYYTLVPSALDEFHDAVVRLRPRLPVLADACCG